MSEAKTSKEVSTGLQRVAERARRDPHGKMVSLAHHITVDLLREAFVELRKDAAAGVDGVTKGEFGAELEKNLQGLHQELREGRYRHKPIRRVQIPKGDGKLRPIGVSTIRDKLVQKGVCEVLAAVYEQDFLDCSFGFRPGRSAHDALAALNRMVNGGAGAVILEADIKSFFDSLDRSRLREMLEERIDDKSLMRLVGKCLHVGVLDGEELTTPDEGTTQGSVLSPLLGNIYLHHVLDVWFEREVKPSLKGKAGLVRYADDFVIGFERTDDARMVMEMLTTRFAAYKLTLHPEKTRLVEFRRPPRSQTGGKGPGTFDFLGFTMYWKRNDRSPGWHLSWKTKRTRMHRAASAIWEWCRTYLHLPINEQHQALVRRLQGHFNYFGVNDNLRACRTLRQWAQRAWYRWLKRRSQRSCLTWKRFQEILEAFPLPQVRVYKDLWAVPR